MKSSQLFHWSPRAPMPLPRAGCAVGVLHDQVYVAGGTYWEGERKIWCDRTDSFDPVSNTWTAHPPVPRLAGDAAGVVVGESFAVIGGGAGGAGATEVWAFDGSVWNPWPALPAPRRSCVAVLHEGQVFVLGGLAGAGTEFGTATNTVWRAPPGQLWTACAPMPAPIRFNLAVGSVGGRLFVAGGCTPDGGGVRNLDEILAYDAKADSWSRVGRLPMPCRGSSGVADGDRLLVVGGYTDEFLTQILAFEPASGRVSRVGELPVGLADTRFLKVGERVIGVTGENGIKRRFPDTLEAGPALL
jgi:N-acetylneuraminic acid mutarotase